MSPDLLSFGPFFLSHLGDIGERLGGHRLGPPDPDTIPSYVYQSYNVTHSLVVWAAVVLAVGCWRKQTSRRFLWLPLGAWALHILCDMPTHSTRFFPTPYLWPFPTPFIDGTPWGSQMFMILNYSGLALAYLFLQYRKSRRQTA